jgi:DNA-3-methyladenine glycosylase I
MVRKSKQLMCNKKMIKRCDWCGDDPLYVQYHDDEWGRFVTDDKILFEFLTLESAQAGLSWITILRKRENYRRAFAGFDAARVAKFNDADVARLMADSGIIRNKLKIHAAITNAQHFLEVVAEFGSFANYLLGFFPNGAPIINHPKTVADIPTKSPISDAIAKDMKRRGFKFFGTTICYSHLQATGFINDHLIGCEVKEK